MSWFTREGDCAEILRERYYDGMQFDACVTDPPYSYSFMGNSWDNLGRGFQGWCSEWGAEILRVLKPGAYALVFGGTRTYHRLTCGLEDAGFEIRDCIHWIYGNGFPKAKSCLKAAHEPIVVARKPAKRATAFPGLDGCKVHSAGSEGRPYTVKRLKPGAALEKTGGNWRPDDGTHLPWEPGREYHGKTTDGRWPPNILLSEEAAAELDAQSGHSISRKQPKTERKGGRSTNFAMSTSGQTHSDSGGASRFFPVFRYQAKAPRSERPVVPGLPGHPTVKPLELMRWLVRLVTPPGGYVLDPFAGSGTTAEACELEGFHSLLIESDPGYIRHIEQRMSKYPRERWIGDDNPDRYSSAPTAA